jgi:hypothetical protein
MNTDKANAEGAKNAKKRGGTFNIQRSTLAGREARLILSNFCCIPHHPDPLPWGDGIAVDRFPKIRELGSSFSERLATEQVRQQNTNARKH